MNTRTRIISTSRVLFNTHGFRNVTLRAIAKELNISYGNVTYHFKTKRDLIVCLYQGMLEETNHILKTMKDNDLLYSILEAPQITYDLSMKYLFFFVDYVEIKRYDRELSQNIERDNTRRKSKYLIVLNLLQKGGLLQKELTNDDLEYLMDLSGAIRTFFFMNLDPSQYNNDATKENYVTYVNKLLFPYLTDLGKKKFHAHCGT